MKNFQTFQLAVAFFKLTRNLNLHYTLKDQIFRASSSIALNLAEGRGKPTTRDQLRFLHIAMGSARECQAILTLAELENSEAWRTLDNLAAHLFRLIKNAE